MPGTNLLDPQYGAQLCNADGNILLAAGTTVPTDTTAGYVTGCIFQHTDGTTNTALYVNEGSVTSCDFNAMAAGGATTSFTITGAEAGNATLQLYADESDDAADRWSVAARAASTSFTITNASLTATTFAFTAGSLAITAEEGANASLVLDADEGDDNADTWTLQSTASDNDLDFINHTTTVANLSSTGLFTAAAGLRSSSVTAPIGYTGAGDAETQATDKSTTVVCTTNAVTGDITMNAAQLNAATTVSFSMTNTSIAITDYVLVTHVSAGTVGSYLVSAAAGAGSATVTVRNITAGNLAEAIVLRYVVIKAAAAA